MKINWKELSKTKGYKSLKACYLLDVKEIQRTKKESYSRFQWVLGRAKHYSLHLKVPIEEILNEWEAKRDYWWANYYGEYRQPKFGIRKIAPNALNYIKKQKYGDKRYMQKCILDAIHFYQMKKSTKKKPRLDMDHKRRLAYHRHIKISL